MPKLIRDKIPEIMCKNGQKFCITMADPYLGGGNVPLCKQNIRRCKYESN